LLTLSRMRIRRILCPVDFSQPSQAALHCAADLARQFGAQLTILHVYQVPAYPLPEGVLLPSRVSLFDLFERLDRALASWKRDAEQRGAPHVDVATTQGAAWSEICRTATCDDYQLIVIGTHGHTGLRHLLLGSVAERVVRHAPCPVMTVRSHDERLVEAVEPTPAGP
jgi:nucleotide-binding universal stress UspA family protein